MKELCKKCGLAASALLALVLLISFASLAQGTIETPTLVSPENNENTNDSTPLMDWGDVTGADNYHIQIDNDNDYSSTTVENNNVISVSNYTVPSDNQLPDGVYYWRVRGENENTDGNYSSPASR